MNNLSNDDILLDTWDNNATKLVEIIENSGIKKDNWLIGGSSALMLDLYHRLPGDIDIFIKNDDFDPIRNFIVQSEMRFKDQSAKFNKFSVFYDLEIEFILMESKFDYKLHEKGIGNSLVNSMSVNQIISEKLNHRQFILQITDIFDTACAYQVLGDDLVKSVNMNESSLMMARSRRKLLEDDKTTNYQIENLKIFDKFKNMKNDFMNIFDEFLNEKELLLHYSPLAPK